MKGVFLLLGSNLGNRQIMLDKALNLIENEIGAILACSSIYHTKAWGIEDQPDFLNQAIEIDSSLPPNKLLIKINAIEEKLGRIRRIKWHSRIIDIDILYYNKLILETEDLIIPHAEIQFRKFALMPMVEIAPDFVHPKLMLSQRELLARCTDELTVKKEEAN